MCTCVCEKISPNPKNSPKSPEDNAEMAPATHRIWGFCLFHLYSVLRWSGWLPLASGDLTQHSASDSIFTTSVPAAHVCPGGLGSLTRSCAAGIIESPCRCFSPLERILQTSTLLSQHSTRSTWGSLQTLWRKNGPDPCPPGRPLLSRTARPADGLSAPFG